MAAVISPAMSPAVPLPAAAVSEEPLYFAGGARGLFGWLHLCHAESRTPLGVVVCAPFGFEAMCLHRCMRALANELALSGLPVLRFDYAGTGDSADVASELDQIPLWAGNIEAAVAELQQRCGVPQVCLVGFRLGALLAALASSKMPAVAALVAIAPPVSGRRYVRELQLQQWVVQSALAKSDKPSASSPALRGGIEASGFVLAERSIATLQHLELTRLDLPAKEVLILDRGDLPEAQNWASHLQRCGATVDYRVLADYTAMVQPPQFALVSRHALDAASSWLSDRQRRSAIFRDSPLPTVAADRIASTTLDSPSLALSGAVTERPVWLDAQASLFAIVSEPHPAVPVRAAVLLLNSGGDHHIGPRRLYVALARRWAADGYVVLRMDLNGLGDSGAPGGCCPGIFPASAIADMRRAASWLTEHYGLYAVTLCGLCTGAYHALRAAVAGLPVSTLLMINPLRYLPLEDEARTDVAEAITAARNYRQRLLAWRSWRKLLRGRVDVVYFVRIARERVKLTLHARMGELARWIGGGTATELGRELQLLAARDVRMVMVFSRRDAGLELLRLQAGSALARVGARLHCHIVEGADHDFTGVAMRAELARILSDELENQLSAMPLGWESPVWASSTTT